MGAVTVWRILPVLVMIRRHPENPFGHMTHTFPLRASRGRVTVAGNRLHLNLSIAGFKRPIFFSRYSYILSLKDIITV